MEEATKKENQFVSFRECRLNLDFESSGNYLKHVIIFACLDEVNPPLFSKKAD